jgi:hypothetical protein
MNGIFKVVDADGKVKYTNVPSAEDQPATAEAGKAARGEREPYDPKVAEGLIREAQKRIPKMVDYLNYLEYLRHSSPLRLDRVLQQLKEEDLEAWVKLQKYPQFRPLHQSALGLKAAEKHLAAGVGLATGKFTGSVEKWMETSVRDLMKRDRWGEHADVLGGKATTLPGPKPPTYSKSRLGQYLKEEDARLLKAAKAAAKEVELSQAGLRAARAGAITRVGATGLDFLLAAMDPNVAMSVGQDALHTRARKLYERGVIDEEQWSETQQLLASGKYVEMKKLMDDAVNAYVRGR